jgi:hypothetical protein
MYGKTYGKNSESASTSAEEMDPCMGKVYGDLNFSGGEDIAEFKAELLINRIV